MVQTSHPAGCSSMLIHDILYSLVSITWRAHANRQQTHPASVRTRQSGRRPAEIVQLKMVIGLIISKLPPEQREDIIFELRDFGLSNSAQEFTQFVVE